MTNAQTRYNGLKVVATAWFLSVLLLMTTFLIALFLPVGLKVVVTTIGAVIGGVGPISFVLVHTLALARTPKAKKKNGEG